MVLVQSCWEKGDEPLPAGFKGWQLGLPLGFAAPACSQPLLLLVALSTPHGSHLSLSFLLKKKKKKKKKKTRDRMSTTLTRPFLDSLHTKRLNRRIVVGRNKIK
jgi:hypothetical protein